jgi:hypothetical protein
VTLRALIVVVALGMIATGVLLSRFETRVNRTMVLTPHPLCERVCKAYVTEAGSQGFIQAETGDCYCRVTPDP